MNWFKRIKGGITTTTQQKKEMPEGLWIKCLKCKNIIPAKENEENLYVCANCNYHQRINAKEYFNILFDKKSFTEINSDMESEDPLEFKDKKTYYERLESTKEKTGLKNAINTAYGTINGENVVIACMNFNFIGGSMGSVVGEKISRAVTYCIEKKNPLIIISKSGGARMMEAAISLMQLVKTSAKIAKLGEEKIPYISVLTDPTFGGATASFSMLGDVNIAEPNALIGFAGPKVVKETIGKDLPEGFQTSEFLLEHGFLDFITERKDLKTKLTELIKMMKI
ncbi:MAG: acetyl-CoA carboxylase, carboxyltransferase subunit beta [Bacteroidota bacterium]|nr:acetyl-CoA carboxylase, carboxyltransferase subunit beta [Bacteroidota bacterium]